MVNKEEFCYFDSRGCHKGFYYAEEPEKLLSDILYSQFFKTPDDPDFPYFSAYTLLCGSCHIFAISLNKIFGYTPYVIEGKAEKSFHAFCQIYKNRKWFYVDARGITSSFDEFMKIAKTFVTNEYIIRPLTSEDVEQWEDYNNFDAEAYSFAEAIISKYENYYKL